MTNPFHPFTPPFTYDPCDHEVHDAKGRYVLAVQAETRNGDRTRLGQLICQLMNEHAMKEGL